MENFTLFPVSRQNPTTNKFITEEMENGKIPYMDIYLHLESERETRDWRLETVDNNTNNNISYDDIILEFTVHQVIEQIFPFSTQVFIVINTILRFRVCIVYITSIMQHTSIQCTYRIQNISYMYNSCTQMYILYIQCPQYTVLLFHYYSTSVTFDSSVQSPFLSSALPTCALR